MAKHRSVAQVQNYQVEHKVSVYDPMIYILFLDYSKVIQQLLHISHGHTIECVSEGVACSSPII